MPGKSRIFAYSRHSMGKPFLFHPFYPEQIRGKEEAVIVAAKLRQLTADKMGKDQFLRGDRRNLAGEGVVRLSP